ncbi:coenzyme F420-0:L-glutamate ligase [Micromonospora sp. NPDC049523]|uniref:coenzyme F420-0:L-glutamate ligase n=1 Tax=Micromonospora sp. NPDC049523 TaxID=3155921 RepID=UPI0034480E96
MKLEILPVLGIGDVAEGDDLAAMITTAAPWLRDGDVLIVTSKIVSKAEGRLVDVPAAEGPERDAAREEILTAETARPVARRGPVRIVQTHHGFVMASAGIDASNVDPSRLVLLPKDPDASARGLRAALRERHGADVAVIISDTMGRPWRNGLTDVALGVAGLSAIRDHRGEVDPYGNELSITQMAVVDELAGAGELVKGKRDQVPVAVVRGYLNTTGSDDGSGATVLVRDAELDLFSLGTAEARASGLRAAATLPEAATPSGAGPDGTWADPVAVARAIAAVAGVIAPGTVFSPATHEEVRDALAIPDRPATAIAMVLCTAPEGGTATAGTLVRFGADLHRLRAALAAEGIESSVVAPPVGSTATAALAL